MRRKSTALSVNVVGAASPDSFRLVLGKGSFFLLVLVFALLLGLASVTVYNFFDTQQTTRRSGTDLVMQQSSSVREQQLNKIIEMNQQRMAELQDENNRRKQDVTDLETRVAELSKSIDALKQLAREVESKVPNGAPAPNPTPGG
jgi:uncharacterized protein HemX